MLTLVQVDSNPRQNGGINCGLWTGLAAEVFASNATGRFLLKTVGADTEMVCEGERPDFLMTSESWPGEQDIALARLFGQAAALAYWRWQYPNECEVLEELWLDVVHPRLKAAMPSVQSTGRGLWYALPGVYARSTLYLSPPEGHRGIRLTRCRRKMQAPICS